ncbi:MULTISPECIES: SDR family NAD(P)-dependent oxidoreductase [unclassified Roseitalea]|uniref:SDR family NAD(P)-dependent oxidoreductase n=1 Tax=unclassified Roseitalea TaxID=2639107 RepID=UPI00273F569F|nr:MULTISPECIES: SDR family NAD(P)-dependent oxidoreductase [unclassified Roseitalea]
MAGGRRAILITGGTSGIGLALVRRLAPRHDLLVAGRRAPDDAAAVLPQGVRYVHAPLTTPEEAVRTVAEAVLKAGWVRLDNAILNAGVGFAVPGGIETAGQIRATLDVNLTASVMLARTLHPWLARAGGTLTLVGSVARRGQGLFPAYAASKAGLHGLARALRSEWRDTVAVQVIHPGPTRTGMHAKAGHDPGRLGAVFLPAGPVAAMIEGAIAARRSPVTVSHGRFVAGGALWSRRL